jgi:nucleoside-diphosphate kinase
MQTTLVIIKPDALDRGLAGEIMRRLERAGLRVVDARMVKITPGRLARHYAELRRKLPRAFERTARSLAGRKALALAVEGTGAIAKVRTLIGPTEPATAPPGTVRGDFSSDTIALADSDFRALNNLVHAADEPGTATRELAIWFGRRRG